MKTIVAFCPELVDCCMSVAGQVESDELSQSPKAV